MNKPNYREVSILVVDDDDIDFQGIKRAFKKLRIANPLYRAKDGVEGLEMMRNSSVSQPYVVLLDLNMPRMGGLEMLKAIRNDSSLTHSVIFVLTTSQDDEDRISAYREHIAGYILKSALDDGFCQLIKLLDHYWRLVELPIVQDGK